ncbi:MAG: hypothetical protein AB1896_10850 [Thermodesulfobacteriota bacterium]
MTKRFLVLTAALLLFSLPASAADFLGVPLPAGGRETARSDQELALAYDQTQEEVVKFYQEALGQTGEIKLRQRNGQSRIEDYGNRPWHKIVIVKDEKGLTSVTITKDSWTWIIGMLILRFTGVFVVLLVLYLAMSAAAWVIYRLVSRTPAPAK